jgi:iron complex outermembrane receptor protein
VKRPAIAAQSGDELKRAIQAERRPGREYCRGKVLTRLIIMAGLLMTFSIVAYSQEPQPAAQSGEDLTGKSLEDLASLKVDSVYSASKYMQKVTEAPASVTIITREEIQRYGWRTLADILGSVRGFYVSYDRQYAYVGVRGFARPGDFNSRILLLLDGHRVNENIYDGGYIGTDSSVEVDLIERIEIVRGPSSSLYGTNAFFAVINVITRRGEAVKGGEVSAEVASFNTFRGRLSFGHKWGSGTELLLSGTLYGSRGQRRLYFREFDSPATSNGIARNLDGDRFQNVLLTVTHRGFTLQSSLVSRKKEVPTASFGALFNQAPDWSVDTRGYVDLSYHRVLAGDTQMMGRVYYDHYEFDAVVPYAGSDPKSAQPVINHDFSLGSWWGGELQLSRKMFRRHQLTGGFDYRHNLRQRQVNFDAEPYFSYADTRPRTSNYGLYLQDEISLHDHLKFNAGVRYDRYSTFGGVFNPRFAVIWQPLARTTIKLLHGRAFRAPNVYELYYSTPVFQASPDLRPERIRTSEIILEQYFGSHFRFSVSGFDNRISGLINQELLSDGTTLQFRNLGRVGARGLELEAEGRLKNGIQGRASYSFQRATDLGDGSWINNSPRHLGKLNLTGPLIRKRLFGGLELQYLSRRRTLLLAPQEDARSVLLPNFTLFSPALFKGLDVTFSLYNLFDQRYGHPGGDEHTQNIIEQDGRAARLKLTYRF